MPDPFMHFVKHLSVKSEIADCILSLPVSFSTNCFMSFCSDALRVSMVICNVEIGREDRLVAINYCLPVWSSS